MIVATIAESLAEKEVIAVTLFIDSVINIVLFDSVHILLYRMYLHLELVFQ